MAVASKTPTAIVWIVLVGNQRNEVRKHQSTITPSPLAMMSLTITAIKSTEYLGAHQSTPSYFCVRSTLWLIR